MSRVKSHGTTIRADSSNSGLSNNKLDLSPFCAPRFVLVEQQIGPVPVLCSFPVEEDEYFYQLVRYVERNALRANLVQHAEEWKWSSLWRRERGTLEQQKCLVAWPLPCPRGWMKYVNDPETEVELNVLRRCVKRGQPFGSDRWIEETAKQLNLESTLRTPGRPRHSQ